MGVTLWHFAETPGGSMQRIPAARFERFWDGKERLRPSAPGELRTVQVALIVDRRRVERFVHANHNRYLVSEDGTLDPAHREHVMAGLGEWVFGPELDPATNVVDLAPRLAKRDYDIRHVWTPAPGQLDEVAAAINAAAVQPPVAVVMDGELRGV